MAKENTVEYWLDTYIELGKMDYVKRKTHPVSREYDRVAELLPESVKGIFDYCVYKAREALNSRIGNS